MIGRTNAGGGGGNGATLTVNAPAGVSVIATNIATNRTYTRTANSSGIAVFKGLKTGTYNVHITDGTTTSNNFTAEVVADYTLSVKFFAAYINVTYPAGSTCTCSDGVTTFTATDTSGSYKFVVPNTGKWTVVSTDGSQTTSTEVSITADEQSTSITLTYFTATINVTYPAGSTCTCTNGSTTYTAPNTSGSWSCVVPSAGTWTVSCSNGSQSKSQAVSITTNGQSSSVTLSYRLHLYNWGVNNYDLCGRWSSDGYRESAASPSGGAGAASDHIYCQGSKGSYEGCVGTEKAIDLTNYSFLRLYGASNNTINSFVAIVTNKYYFNDSTAAAVQLPLNQDAYVAIDISNLSGAYYIVITANNDGGFSYAHEIYLE